MFVVPYGVTRNPDAIIRVRMVLCENLNAIIRVSNYVRLHSGLQRARLLWSGANDKLIMHILPAETKFMLPSIYYNLWHTITEANGCNAKESKTPYYSRTLNTIN